MKMAVEYLFVSLHMASVVGMGYVGWRTGGPAVKEVINHDKIKAYKEKIINFRQGDLISEDKFCSLTGALSGMLLGRILWPITLPYSIWFIQREHGPPPPEPPSGKIEKIIRNLVYN